MTQAIGRWGQRKRVAAHLISIEDADKLIGRDGDAGRVDLAEAVVQIARLSIHLPNGPLPATDVHKIVAQVLDPASHISHQHASVLMELTEPSLLSKACTTLSSDEASTQAAT